LYNCLSIGGARAVSFGSFFFEESCFVVVEEGKIGGWMIIDMFVVNGQVI